MEAGFAYWAVGQRGVCIRFRDGALWFGIVFGI